MTCSPDLPGDIAGLQSDLMRVAQHLTHNRDQAEDLSQEVLLKLWTKARGGEDIENLRAYAMTILRNSYRQSLRMRVSSTELEDDMLVSDPSAFAALALQELQSAIARLPDDQARLIHMVAAGDTSPADLAQRTGLPKGTVMSRLARARARLREDMGVSAQSPVSALI